MQEAGRRRRGAGGGALDDGHPRASSSRDRWLWRQAARGGSHGEHGFYRPQEHLLRAALFSCSLLDAK